jgi:hypothetical protein
MTLAERLGSKHPKYDEQENDMVRLMYYCTMFRYVSRTLMAVRKSPPGYLTPAFSV